MGAANPAYSAITRTWRYGASDAAVAALAGTKYGNTSATMSQAWERIYCGRGLPVTVTGATFGVGVTATYSVTGAWLIIRETATGASYPTDANSTIVANSGNILGAALTADSLVTYAPAMATMTFTPRVGYDYWMGVAIYAPTSHMQLYYHSATTSDGSYQYYATQSDPATSTGTYQTPRNALMLAVTFATANNLIRSFTTTTIGSGKTYMIPRCTTPSAVEHIIVAGGNAGGAAIAARWSLKTLTSGESYSEMGAFGLDFSGGNLHGIGTASGDQSWELGADATSADSFWMDCVLAVGEADYDVFYANGSHKGLGSLAASDIVPYSSSYQCSALGALYAWSMANADLHDYLVITGNGGNIGTIHVGARPAMLMSDSEFTGSNGDAATNMPSAFSGQRPLYHTGTGGRSLTADSAVTTAGHKVYDDPLETYMRLRYVKDCLIVLAYGVNDTSLIAGADGSAAEAISCQDMIAAFIGRIGGVISAAMKDYATYAQHVVVCGPLIVPDDMPPGDIWTAAQRQAVRSLHAGLQQLCARTGTVFVPFIDVTPANGIHITSAQGATLCARIAAAYEAGVAPAIAAGGAGISVTRRNTMNLAVMTSLVADATDQPVIVPRGSMLLVHSINASCDVRSTPATTEKFTIPADTPTPLGESLGQTIYLRAASGTVIQLALI